MYFSGETQSLSSVCRRISVAFALSVCLSFASTLPSGVHLHRIKAAVRFSRALQIPFSP